MTKTAEKIRKDISGGLLESIQNEMHAWGISLRYLNFIKEGIEKCLNEAKGKDEFLIPMGIYSLPECKHTEKMLDHKGDCKSYFSDNYKTYNLKDQKQKPGPAIRIDMRKMQPGKDGTYMQIYSSYGKPLEMLAIPENRIVDAIFSTAEECKKLRDDADLRNFWIHFLVKKENVKAGEEEFFVFDFRVLDGGLFFYLDPVSDSRVWRGVHEYRFGVLVE